MAKLNLNVVFLLVLGFGLASSTSEPTILMPTDAPKSFDLTFIQMKNADVCSYLVNITTSCTSPIFTRDHISIAFGDASGNQVYSPIVVNPLARAFSRCSSDTYTVDGPCAHRICFLYVQRTGEDGWEPETVKIYSQNSKAPATFNYNTSIPEDVWFGFNLCSHPTPPPATPTLPPFPFPPPTTPTRPPFPFPFPPPEAPSSPPPPPPPPPRAPTSPPPPPPAPSSSRVLVSENSFVFVFVSIGFFLSFLL